VPTSRARSKPCLDGSLLRRPPQLRRTPALADRAGLPALAKGGNQWAPSCIQVGARCSGTLRRRCGAPPWYPREPGRSTRFRRPSASCTADRSPASIAGQAAASPGPPAQTCQRTDVSQPKGHAKGPRQRGCRIVRTLMVRGSAPAAPKGERATARWRVPAQAACSRHQAKAKKIQGEEEGTGA
jgi:hypothetical protein